MKKCLLLAVMLAVAVAAYGANETANMTLTLAGKPVAVPSGTDYVLTIPAAGGQVNRTAVNKLPVAYDQITSALKNNTLETLGVNIPASQNTSQVFEILQPASIGTHKATITVDPNLTADQELKIGNGTVTLNGSAITGGAAAPMVTTDLNDWPSQISPLEIGALDGVTSNLQTQINSLQTATGFVAVPLYSDAPCSVGQWSADTGYLYNCVGTNSWTKTALSSWSAPTPDTTPDQFTFTDQTNVAVSTLITSAPITVAGISSPTPISVTGGSYSLDGGSFTTASGTVTNGQAVRAQHTSSGSASTMTNTTVTIGNVADTFSSTTVAGALTMYASQSGMSSGTQLNNSTSTTYIGGIIDAAGTHSVKKLRVYVRTVSGTSSIVAGKAYKARLYTLNGSKGLNTIKAESTAYVTGVAAAGYIEFSFASGTLSQGDAWVVYGLDDVDNINYINIGYANYTAPTPDLDGGYSHFAFWNVSGALTSENLTRDQRYELYE